MFKDCLKYNLLIVDWSTYKRRQFVAMIMANTQTDTWQRCNVNKLGQQLTFQIIGRLFFY